MTPAVERQDKALTILRDHCREQATLPEADPLWTQLADEIDQHLTGGQTGQTAVPEGQEALIP